MTEHIIPVDKKLRKQTLIGLLLLILIGAFLIQAILAHFEEIKSLAITNPDLSVLKVKEFVCWVIILNAILSLAFCVYFVSIAIRILKSKRYPPPGMRVIKDTRLQTGKKAKAMAIVQIIMAVFAILTNAVPWYLYVIIEKLLLR